MFTNRITELTIEGAHLEKRPNAPAWALPSRGGAFQAPSPPPTLDPPDAPSHPTPHTPHPTLPPPTPSLRLSISPSLLSDYLSASLPLEGLAARHRLTLDQLLDIIESPEFEHMLTRIERTAARRATAIARAAAPEATLALTDIAYRAADRNPDPARKAANAILKLANPKPAPSEPARAEPNSPHPNPPGGRPAARAIPPCATGGLPASVDAVAPSARAGKPPVAQAGAPGVGLKAKSEQRKAQVKTRGSGAPRPASAELCALSGETAFPASPRDLRVLRGEKQARDPPPPGSRCA